MDTSGPLALIGSGEFEPWSEGLDRFLLSRATGDGSAVIVPTASAKEGEAFTAWGEKGLEHYDRLGVPARVASLKSRDDAFRSEMVALLEPASLVYFSGGNPAFLARTLAGTDFWSALLAAWERGAAIAGCSAGACIAGEVAPPTVTERVPPDQWIQGLRLVPNAWIFPHWDALDSHEEGQRAFFLRSVPPHALVAGIDERTAMVTDDEAWRVFGEGTVSVYQGDRASTFAAGDRFELRTSPGLTTQLGAGIASTVDRVPEGCGAIGLLSGNEFTTDVAAFDEALLEAAGPRVAILLCADPDAAPRQAHLARVHYERLGAEPVALDVLERRDAGPKPLPDYDVLFIGGGSPSTLLECLRGTPLWEEILKRWTQGRALAGSSAGAMALCKHCLIPEPGADMPTRWTRGIGPVSRFGLAVHATSRPPEWLQQVSRSAPVPVVAMDDAAGLVLRADAPPRPVGGGRVWVVEPAD